MPIRIGTVAQLWRYPVKSMGGERLDSATLTWRGIPGDRGWALYDETRRGITGAKRLPLLKPRRPRRSRSPTGLRSAATLETHRAASAICSGARSPCTRWVPRAPTPPRLTTEGESEEAVRALMGLMPGEPVPDMSEFPPERLRLLRLGNFFDALPIHLLTRTTLTTLARLAPESAWDERRFRPNLLVEVEESDGYPELGWIRRR